MKKFKVKASPKGKWSYHFTFIISEEEIYLPYDLLGRNPEYLDKYQAIAEEVVKLYEAPKGEWQIDSWEEVK